MDYLAAGDSAKVILKARVRNDVGNLFALRNDVVLTAKYVSGKTEEEALNEEAGKEEKQTEKVEAVPAPEPVAKIEEKPVKEASPEKKTTTKKDGKKAADKDSVKEVAEKVRKGRKADETFKNATKPIAPVIAVQALMGGTIVTDEVIKKVKAVAPDVEQIYVKPEENKAYWVSKKRAGSVDLWD